MRVYLELSPLSGSQYSNKENVDLSFDELLWFTRQPHTLSYTVMLSFTLGNINKKLSSCVILCQWHNSPGPQFSLMYNDDINITYYMGLLWNWLNACKVSEQSLGHNKSSTCAGCFVAGGGFNTNSWVLLLLLLSTCSGFIYAVSHLDFDNMTLWGWW